MQAIGNLKVPFLIEHPPRFKMWVNTGNFTTLTVAPKHRRDYLNCIAESLWPLEKIGSMEFLNSKRPEKSLHAIGSTSLNAQRKKEVADYKRRN